MAKTKKKVPNRPDGLYEVKITIGKTLAGKLIRKSFYSPKSKEDAKRIANQWRINQAAYDLLGISETDNTMTFEQWANTWLENYKKDTVKESTYLDTYKRIVDQYLIPNFGSYLLKNIKPAHIKTFYTKMSKTYYESTLKKMRLCLNAIFETAIENDICMKNPAKRITYSVKKQPNKKDIYSESELKKVLTFASTHTYGLPIILMGKLGLRRSEVVVLKWGDVDFNQKTIHIERAITVVSGIPVLDQTKSKSSNRILPFDEELQKILLRYYKNDNDAYIIGNLSNPKKYISPDTFVRNRFEPFMRDLVRKYPELRRLSPHEMRHTCGTLLYQKTGDIYAVSKFLGHADINITTKIYVHDNVEALRKALNL